MRVAVDLHPKPDPRAEEVQNCLSFEYNMLTTKLEAIELGIRERPPKPHLRLGRISPHLMRASQQLRFRGHHFPTPTPPLKGRGLVKFAAYALTNSTPSPSR